MLRALKGPEGLKTSPHPFWGVNFETPQLEESKDFLQFYLTEAGIEFSSATVK